MHTAATGIGCREGARRSAPRRDGAATGLFFFQAEDGIRDYKVTGVQTCALPISPVAVEEEEQAEADEDEAARDLDHRVAVAQPAEGSHRPGESDPREQEGGGESRSEERRVGKEGRSRWSPYH